MSIVHLGSGGSQRLTQHCVVAPTLLLAGPPDAQAWVLPLLMMSQADPAPAPACPAVDAVVPPCSATSPRPCQLMAPAVTLLQQLQLLPVWLSLFCVRHHRHLHALRHAAPPAKAQSVVPVGSASLHRQFDDNRACRCVLRVDDQSRCRSVCTFVHESQPCCSRGSLARAPLQGA